MDSISNISVVHALVLHIDEFSVFPDFSRKVSPVELFFIIGLWLLVLLSKRLNEENKVFGDCALSHWAALLLLYPAGDAVNSECVHAF